MYYHQNKTAACKNKCGSDDRSIRKTHMYVTQLIFSVLIFFIVFWGRGNKPENFPKAYQRLRQVISLDYDSFGVQKWFETNVLDSFPVLMSQQPWINRIFYSPTDIPPQVHTAEDIRVLNLKSGYIFANERDFTLVERYLYAPPKKIFLKKEAITSSESIEPVVPAAGTVLEYIECTEPLPDRYTMHRLSLGNLNTVTPILGHVNSEYGFRVHPIDGKNQFHAGVDLGGQYGDPIKAFADGTVEYIGEDDSYGLYMQIDHQNGVKSFYAHCQSLQVTQGQKLAAGEVIGTVGASGSATGPHLHLELKWNKTYLNPIYYIDVLEE